jgi:hypothetical protein
VSIDRLLERLIQQPLIEVARLQCKLALVTHEHIRKTP